MISVSVKRNLVSLGTANISPKMSLLCSLGQCWVLFLLLRELLSSPSWPWTHNPPSQVLGLQVHTMCSTCLLQNICLPLFSPPTDGNCPMVNPVLWVTVPVNFLPGISNTSRDFCVRQGQPACQHSCRSIWSVVWGVRQLSGLGDIYSTADGALWGGHTSVPDLWPNDLSGSTQSRNILHLILSSPWWTHWVWGKRRFGVQVFCTVQTTHLHTHTHNPTFI